MSQLHSILKRQLNRYHLDSSNLPNDWKQFLDAVNQSYLDADEDIASIKRSLDLSSQEFREIEKKMSDALDKYQSLIGNLTIAVIRTDLTGKILEANQACASILEVPSIREFMQHNMSDFYRNKEDRKYLIEQLQSTNTLRNVELPMVTATGKNIIVLINIAIKKEVHGTIVLDAIVEDITFRKDAERELKEAHDLLEARVAQRTKDLEVAKASLVNVLNELTNEKKQILIEKAKYDTILSGIGDGVWVMDPQGNVLLVNAALENMLGVKKEEILSKSITNVCIENDQHHSFTLEERPTIIAMRTKKTVSHPLSDPVYIVRKDGTRFPAMMLSTPLYQNNELFGGVAIIRDITKDLEIDRQKNEFISIASHELRTPLTAIDGIVSMLLAGDYGPISDNIKEPLSDVNTSSQRLIELINDLLSLSRIQEGRLLPELSDFSIAVKIKNVIDLLTPTAKQKGLQIYTENIDDVSVQADAQKIDEVLENIIGNALKFTDTGKITIFTKVINDLLHIHIQDTGLGIAAEDQEKLFKKFVQIPTKSSRPAGTGLGLYISRETLKKMGGDLWLDHSNIGEGSDFCFTLPISGTPTATEAKNLLAAQNLELKQD